LQRDFAAAIQPIRSLPEQWSQAPIYPIPFGEYELLGELGSGGMGIVFRARHPATGRVVALKMLRSGKFATSDERKRFRNEAAACLELDHPAIVPIYSVGEVEQQPYFTLRMMSGGALSTRHQSGQLDPQQAARLILELAGAVDYAHRRGILHRDLKPSNVLFDGEGHVFLADFGLARRVDDTHSASATSAGTPGYMAPEQRSSGESTTATDIHGLGGLLHFLLTAEPPHHRQTLQPTPRKNLPRDLEAIIVRCLAATPSERYASAVELTRDLQAFLRGEVVSVRKPMPHEILRRFVLGHPSLTMFLLMLGLAIPGMLFLAERDASKTHRLNADLSASLSRERDAAVKMASFHDSTILVRAGELAREGKLHDAAQHLATAYTFGETPRPRGYVWSCLEQQLWPNRTLTGHYGHIFTMSLSPDEKTLVSLAQDGLRFWDLRTGLSTAPKVMHFETRNLLNYHRDGQQIAFLTGDPASGTVWLRMLRLQGEVVSESHHNLGDLQCASWSEDGETLLVSTKISANQSRLHHWNPRTGLVAPLQDKSQFFITSMKRLADGSGTLATCSRVVNGLTVGDLILIRGDVIEPFEIHFPYGFVLLDVAPDHRSIAAVAGESTVFRVDLQTRKVLWQRQLVVAPVAAEITYVDQGRKVLVSVNGVEPNRYYHLDHATGAILDTDSQTSQTLTKLLRDVSAEKSFCGDRVGVIHLRSLETAKPLELHGHRGEVWALAYSPDGKTLASGGDDATIRLWDVVSGTQKKILQGHEALVMSLAFSPDGTKIYSSSWDKTVRVWDSATGESLADWRAHDGPVSNLAISPDGRSLYTQGRDKTVKVWNLATRTLMHTLPGNDRRLSAFALSPNGSRLIVAGQQSRVMAYDTQTWSTSINIPTDKRPTTAACFTPDGQEVLLGKDRGVIVARRTDDGTIRYWHHTEPEISIAKIQVAPDGLGFATTQGTEAKHFRVMLHDVHSGREVLALPHPAPVFGLAFSPDSGTLATACHDGQVRLFRLHDISR
jgi:eukaryotic-like serine/threonine-protein kinase